MSRGMQVRTVFSLEVFSLEMFLHGGVFAWGVGVLLIILWEFNFDLNLVSLCTKVPNIHIYYGFITEYCLLHFFNKKYMKNDIVAMVLSGRISAMRPFNKYDVMVVCAIFNPTPSH